MTPHYGSKQRRTKEPLDESKRREWKSWLKAQHLENSDHGIWSRHFLQIDGETMETVTDFIFGAPKSLQMVTAAMKLKDSCSLEEKLWHLDSVLKIRDITLPTKVHLVKAIFFPAVMYGCESWTLKKAECLRIDAFELWCWRRLLWVPWTARRSNQSILKEISPGYSLEGLILKLKLQYFGHLMSRVNSLEKTLMLGKIEEEKGTTEDEMAGWHHWLSGLEFE